MFIPDLAHMTSPLRPLMKRDAAWTWLQEHEDAFMKTKELLTSTSLVKPFDETKETLMLMDTSRLYGLGFALIQKTPDGNSISLIQCSSCLLSKTQQRCATIELEGLAIRWAVNKCDFSLRGLLAFTVLTDHRPLVGIFRKQLHELDNARLMRMREKLTNFSFKVKWVEGKTNMIANALSRAPVFQPEEEEEEAIDTAI